MAMDTTDTAETGGGIRKGMTVDITTIAGVARMTKARMIKAGDDSCFAERAAPIAVSGSSARNVSPALLITLRYCPRRTQL